MFTINNFLFRAQIDNINLFKVIVKALKLEYSEYCFQKYIFNVFSFVYLQLLHYVDVQNLRHNSFGDNPPPLPQNKILMKSSHYLQNAMKEITKLASMLSCYNPEANRYLTTNGAETHVDRYYTHRNILFLSLDSI